MSIKDGRVLLEAWDLSEELMTQRCSPETFLAKAFGYPISLLAAMADEGALIACSQSLEFFIPGTTDRDSDWDIYVPGNLRAVTNMLTVLKECGVQWMWLGDRLDEFIHGHCGATLEVPCSSLKNFNQWSTINLNGHQDERHRVRERRRLVFYLLRRRLVLVGRDEEDEDDIDIDTDIIRATRLRDDLLFNDACTKVEIIGGGPYVEKTPYEGMIKDRVISGIVRRRQRVTKVRLIICQHTLLDRETTSLHLITNFYASHIQCFISGWCAVQLFPTKGERAITYKGVECDTINAGIAKYKERGYTFEDPPIPLKFPTDRIRIKGGSALLVSFDHLYEGIAEFCRTYRDQVERYTKVRQTSLEMISWFVNSRGTLTMCVDPEVEDIRRGPLQSIRLLPYIARYAPQGENVIREPQSYDQPLENPLILQLVTSGVRMPKMHSIMTSSFFL